MKLLYFSSSFRFLIYFSFHAQPFQLGTCHTVGELVEQEPDVDWKPSVVDVVRPVTEHIEQLRIHQSGDKVECGIGVADDNEQCRLAVAEGVKLHFIVAD